MPDAHPQPEILQGQGVAFFAFDIGYEVDLDHVSRLLSTEPIRRISRAKQTPTYLQYTRPPRKASLGETGIFPGAPGRIQATLFDFGAVSISFRWPLTTEGEPCPLSSLIGLSASLSSTALEQEAWRHARELIQRLTPAITRPALSGLIEDYFAYVIQGTAQPLSGQELLTRYPDTLAGILRAETEPLSPEQVKEALSRTISYYPSDLAIIDWNATILYDADYADTMDVLELLNVELLEARYMDAELDKRLEAYEDLAKKQHRWFLPLVIPHQRTIRELAELRIEAALLAERVDNALKLIGDLYLARIHKTVSERFYMRTWDEAISRKLEIIGNLYQLLTDRINTSQAQALELIIILLIFIEILLNL